MKGESGELYAQELLKPKTGAEERYYTDGLIHLEAYGLRTRRDEIQKRITAHNVQVGAFSAISDPKLQEEMRIRLVNDLADIKKSAKEYFYDLQKVIYDIEDQRLMKHPCAYEIEMSG